MHFYIWTKPNPNVDLKKKSLSSYPIFDTQRHHPWLDGGLQCLKKGAGSLWIKKDTYFNKDLSWFLIQNFGGQSRKPNSKKFWFRLNTLAFGRPLGSRRWSFWPSWLNFSTMEENFLLLAAFFGWRRKFVFFLISPVFSIHLWRLSWQLREI